MPEDFFDVAQNTSESIKVAAFSPNSKPQRYLCLAMRSGGRVGIRAMETFGSASIPYEPFKVQERLHWLESRGFIVVTDSEHELWNQWPHIKMSLREHSNVINRDYALDLLVEYHESGMLALPEEHMGIVPSPLEYRRVGSSVSSQYEFRSYRPTLNVLLVAILALTKPPLLSSTFINEFYGHRLEEETTFDSLKTFKSITTNLDKQIAREFDRDPRYNSQE